MLDFGSPTGALTSSLGDGDLAQVLRQEIQLQQQYGMGDLHAQVQQQLQLEELQARLALLATTSSVPQLPLSSLAALHTGHGLPWDATTTAGSLSMPLPRLPSDPMAAAPLESVHRSLSEAHLTTNSNSSSSTITPVLTSLALASVASSALPVPVSGACISSQQFRQPLSATAAALAPGRLGVSNGPADPTLNIQVQRQLQLLLGAKASAPDAFLNNQGSLSALSEACTAPGMELGILPLPNAGTLPSLKAYGLAPLA